MLFTKDTVENGKIQRKEREDMSKVNGNVPRKIEWYEVNLKQSIKRQLKLELEKVKEGEWQGECERDDEERKRSSHIVDDKVVCRRDETLSDRSIRRRYSRLRSRQSRETSN